MVLVLFIAATPNLAPAPARN